jgi:hypothetical protein
MSVAARSLPPVEQRAFNLNEVIRSVLETSTEADPGKLAFEVAAAIPAEHLRAAVVSMLPEHIRELVGKSRYRNRRSAKAESTPGAVGTPWAQRAAKASEAWRRRLDDRVHVASGWKFLAHCTADDLRSACDERRSIAIAASVIADEYESFANLIVEHDVKTFADLPPVVQAVALGGKTS